MDVKCPQCQTEYELDEGRLRPGGVTVKCANCSHVFRVRKRGDSVLAKLPSKVASSVAAKAKDEELSWLVRLEDGEIKVCRELATLQRWIVSGVVDNTCEISRTGKKWKPLAQLQELSTFFAIAQEAQDIASGRIKAPGSDAPAAQGTAVLQVPQKGRPHTISRHSSSPVPFPDPDPDADLDAPTLEGYTDEMTVQLSAGQQPFLENKQQTVEMSADEASRALQAARASFEEQVTAPSTSIKTVREQAKAESKRPSSPKSTMLGPAIAKRTAPAPITDIKTKKMAAQTPVVAAAPPPPRPRAASVPPPAPPAAKRAASVVPPPTPPSAPVAAKIVPAMGAAPAPAAPPPPVIVAAPTAAKAPSIPIPPNRPSASLAAADSGGGPVGGGPVGGLGAAVVSDVAFASSSIRTDRAATERVSLLDFESDSFGGEEFDSTKNSGAGKWIVLLSLLILGAGAVVLYFVLFKDGDTAGDEEKIAQTPSVVIDAGAPVVTSIDAMRKTPSNDGSVAIAALPTAIARHDRQELLGLVKGLEASPEGANKKASQAWLHNALAQCDLDDGVLLPRKAKALSKSSRKKAKQAETFAKASLAKEKGNAFALVTLADAQRLGGAPSRSVERTLKKVKDSSYRSEANYVSAMLRIRDRRVRDARSALQKMETQGSSFRVKYRLAMLQLKEKKYSEAKEIADSIQGLDGEHEAVSRLLAFIDSKMEPVVAGDGDSVDSGDGDSVDSGDGDSVDSGDGDSSNSKPAVASIDSYDKLLERGDKAAETGNCNQAVKFYEKALDVNPSGVAALTGLGYCHLDFKNYASAQARFRAALGVSSRYQDALWGVAEGYQQQGLKAKAIEGYRNFIAKHPSSRRAEMAKRQIERLGGSLTAKPAEPASGESGSGESGSGESGSGESGSEDSVPAPEPAGPGVPKPEPKPPAESETPDSE